VVMANSSYRLEPPEDPRICMEMWRSIAIHRFGVIAERRECFDTSPVMVPFWYYATDRIEMFPDWLVRAVYAKWLVEMLGS